MLTRLTFVAIAALVLLSARIPAQGDTLTRDQQDVRALYASFVTAQNAHNLATVQSLLWDNPNVYWLTLGGLLEGQAAVTNHLKKLFAGVWSASPDYTNTSIIIRTPTTADVVSPVNIVTTRGGNPYKAKAIVVTTCIKTDNGWKVAGVVPVAGVVQDY